jgi:uncharacterized RDD family membrane protein YckC
MDEQLTISTPEQVAFHYEMAGIGSRFVASLLDHLIIFVALFLIYCAMYGLLISTVVNGQGDEAGVYLVLALMVIITFAIFWGYFALFETVWNGQTPGKRAGRLRVIRRDGQPVRAGEVMIRNLVRLIDFLPGFYGIGLTVMFINKDSCRLGDLAAGTIVVREGELTRLGDVRVSSTSPSVARATQPAYATGTYGTTASTPPYASFGSSPYSPQSAGPYSSAPYGPEPPVVQRYDPLPGISLRDVTPDDYRLIREMLARWSRGELSRDRAYDLAYRLAHGVASRMGQDFREWQARGWEPITFLQSVITAKEARE